VYATTIVSSDTLRKSIRSFKQSRDSIKKKIIYKIFTRIALAIRVVKIIRELIEIIE
jgi:hypothetical protein